MKYPLSKIFSSTKSSDSWIGTFFLNPLSYPLVYFFANFTNIRPEPINSLSLLTGLSAGYFYFKGTPESLAIGAFLVVASYTLDAVDGKIARLKNQVTLFGTRLEAVRDKAVHLSCFFGLIIGQYNLTQNLSILLLSSIYVALLVLNSFLSYNYLRKKTTISASGALASIRLLENIKPIKVVKLSIYPYPSITEVLFVLFLGTPILGLYLSIVIAITLQVYLIHRTVKLS